jgi:hypothetical protein
MAHLSTNYISIIDLNQEVIIVIYSGVSGLLAGGTFMRGREYHCGGPYGG